MITRIERSHFWFLGRMFIPKSKRRAACIARGEHRPELIDTGRSKLCFNCGTW